MMNILLTSASRKVGLVKAFQQALAKEEGGQVIAVDASPYAAALYIADQHYIAPRGLKNDFLTFIEDICQKHHIRLLIPTRDEELPFFAANKSVLQNIGVTVMVTEPDVVSICQNKRHFIEFCQRNEFTVPQTYELSEVTSVTQFPLFVRERFGKGSKWAFKVDSQQDLSFVLSRLKEPIIQENVNADEYTIDLFADFSGRVISVVPRQRLSVFGGESFIGRTHKNWDIINESIRLAQTLGLTGHNTIQCFLHNRVVKFIEVNPRYGGGANLSFAAGALTPHYLVRLLQGKPANPMIGEFKDNFVMLRYTEDVFLTEQDGELWDEMDQ